jgi:tripeptidyl-peptidase-2
MSDSQFPVSALLPKEEIGVTKFLNEHPEFDGRGTVIAIVDTGVDPLAPGLSCTSDGNPKVIDIYNFSGSGDVKTTTVRTASEDGTLEGLSGRKLKIPMQWNNPSGKYHLGIKDIHDLFPDPLRKRLKKSKKEKVWDPAQRLAIADAARLLDRHESDYSSPNLTQKWDREELETRIEILNELEKKYADPGPSYDCVVFHDGKLWQACIDTTLRGNLDRCILMTDYRVYQDCNVFSEEDLMSYSVNIYDNGNLLEICLPTDSHGTHVASIAAAFFSKEPEKNGHAPGAQIISFQISDARMSSVETASAFIRTMSKCIELGVDLINYSFGKASNWVRPRGLMSAWIEEAVFKHDIIFVTSAGNEGPALSTVAAPAATSDAALGIGAYLSPQMASLLYSQSAYRAGSLFTFSSRGPGADGALRISVSAMGGAITSVPLWTLKSANLLTGTSMSSPAACGAIACLLSGLKAKRCCYTPWIIRRALENTAQHPYVDEDVFSIGHGLVNIHKAFDYVLAYSLHGADNGFVRFDVSVNNVGSGGPSGILGRNGGIYLRDQCQVRKISDVNVNVEPVFKDNCENKYRASYSKHIRLQSTVDWITCPNHLSLNNQNRSFCIHVDSQSLVEDAVHYGEIQGFDVDELDEGTTAAASYNSSWPYDSCPGPLFRLPVTVIIPGNTPHSVAHCRYEWKDVVFEAGVVRRHFVHVPEGATWAVLRVESMDADKQNKFVFQAVQLRPDHSYCTGEHYKVLIVPEHCQSTQGIRVCGGHTLELCIAKCWSCPGATVANVSLSFRGLELVAESSCAVANNSYIHRLDVRSTLAYEVIQPIIMLKHCEVTYRASTARVAPLGARDLLHDGRQLYELVLRYNFHVTGDGLTKGSATELNLSVAGLEGYLYEGDLAGQKIMLFDGNNRYILLSLHSAKVEKGDYVALVQLKSLSRDLLQRLREVPLTVRYKLGGSGGPRGAGKGKLESTSGEASSSSGCAMGRSLAVRTTKIAQREFDSVTCVTGYDETEGNKGLSGRLLNWDRCSRCGCCGANGSRCGKMYEQTADPGCSSWRRGVPDDTECSVVVNNSDNRNDTNSVGIKLDCWASYADALFRRDSGQVARQKFGSLRLPAGSVQPLYFAVPSDEKLPAFVSKGCTLSGHLSLSGCEHGKRVAQLPFTLFVSQTSVCSKNTSKSGSNEKPRKKPAANLFEAMRNLRVSYLNRMTVVERDALYAQLCSEYPDYLPVYTTRMNALMDKGFSRQSAPKILHAISRILRLCNPRQLLQYFAAKQDLTPQNSASVKADMKERRIALLDALLLLGSIYASSYMCSPEREDPKGDFPASLLTHWERQNPRKPKLSPLAVADVDAPSTREQQGPLSDDGAESESSPTLSASSVDHGVQPDSSNKPDRPSPCGQITDTSTGEPTSASVSRSKSTVQAPETVVRRQANDPANNNASIVKAQTILLTTPAAVKNHQDIRLRTVSSVPSSSSQPKYTEEVEREKEEDEEDGENDGLGRLTFQASPVVAAVIRSNKTPAKSIVTLRNNNNNNNDGVSSEGRSDVEWENDGGGAESDSIVGGEPAGIDKQQQRIVTPVPDADDDGDKEQTDQVPSSLTSVPLSGSVSAVPPSSSSFGAQPCLLVSLADEKMSSHDVAVNATQCVRTESANSATEGMAPSGIPSTGRSTSLWDTERAVVPSATASSLEVATLDYYVDIGEKLAAMQLDAGAALLDGVSRAEIDRIYVEVARWTDMDASRASAFVIKHALIHRHYARALKALQRQQEDNPSKELDVMCIELYEKLGWIHVVNNTRDWLHVKYPVSGFRLF